MLGKEAGKCYSEVLGAELGEQGLKTGTAGLGWISLSVFPD